MKKNGQQFQAVHQGGAGAVHQVRLHPEEAVCLDGGQHMPTPPKIHAAGQGRGVGHAGEQDDVRLGLEDFLQVEHGVALVNVMGDVGPAGPLNEVALDGGAAHGDERLLVDFQENPGAGQALDAVLDLVSPGFGRGKLPPGHFLGAGEAGDILDETEQFGESVGPPLIIRISPVA